MSKITIEETKNPKIIKFVADAILTESSFEYQSIEEAQNSPLVKQLFQLPFVKKVYITANFIAIERFDMLKWVEVQDDLKDILEAYFEQGHPLFSEEKKNVVEVYAETTPNPNTQKYVTNKFLTKNTIEATSISEAKNIPLALDLFEFPFVKEVFISQNYISITKDNSIEWFEINNEIRDFLKEYIESEREILSEAYEEDNNQTNEQVSEHSNVTTDDEISQQIVSILDEYIKPAVASDGGNIQFKSYDKETKNVNVILQGACNGCPSSTITLKNGIEATLKQFLPNKINSVTALN